ncbi:MAG: glucokinase, partial [Thermoanaerobaculia bacterium]|nr:glucokinase [Thermoanaerobaculia bacterium]
FDDLASAARAALGRLAIAADAWPRAAAVAVAAPAAGDRIELTNAGWSFSVETTRRELGLERLVVLNDLEATALALPHLRAEELEIWRSGDPIGGAPCALVGVGTGLGTAAFIEGRDGRPAALASEGGHCDLAATDEREWQVVGELSKRFGRASAERALSGPGLASLYEALSLSFKEGVQDSVSAAEVVRRASGGGDARAREACGLFSGWLGAFAGDLVLTLGARGGLYLTGGVLAGMGAAFDRERFLARLDAKGRFRDYVAAVPVRRILADDAALRGAASALR